MERFSFDTIKEFDNHISNSIHGYDVLRQIILNISSFFITDKSLPIIDIGCTSGALCKLIRERYGVKTIGYDITDHNFNDSEDLRVADVTAEEFIIPKAQLITSIFTLQFIPLEKRRKVLDKIYKALPDDGTLIICEKEYCEDGRMQEVFTFANYDNKIENGDFTAEEVLNKEKDIRQIMHPQTSKENCMMLIDAGFTKIDRFFQSLNFSGYICRK